MARYGILLLLYLVAYASSAQDSRQVVQVTGIVTDAETKEVLPGAHIINHTSGTTADSVGKFNIPTQPGDTLIISHIGYGGYLVPIPSTLKETHYFIRIALLPSAIELEALTVYQWPATVDQFKWEILALQVEAPKKVKIPGSYEGPPQPVKPGLGSPVSFIYSKFSKRERRRREFLKKRQDIETNQWARARFNVEYVREVTGIEDETRLMAFMEFCKLTDPQLDQMNDYDLIVAINDCYRDFNDQ